VFGGMTVCMFASFTVIIYGSRKISVSCSVTLLQAGIILPTLHNGFILNADFYQNI